VLTPVLPPVLPPVRPPLLDVCPPVPVTPPLPVGVPDPPAGLSDEQAISPNTNPNAKARGDFVTTHSFRVPRSMHLHRRRSRISRACSAREF
jgi:hypothetical protein